MSRRPGSFASSEEPVPLIGERVRTEVELTGGYKAFIGISFIILFIGAAAAVATLVLVAIRFEQNCCEHVKHKVSDIDEFIEDFCDCSPQGGSCSNTKDCCKRTGTTLVCSSGTCQPIVTNTKTAKNKDKEL